MIVVSGRLNVPIWFFASSTLIAVLPPIDASTCPINVVGMLMWQIPLLYVDATKPTRSVIVPPP